MKNLFDKGYTEDTLNEAKELCIGAINDYPTVYYVLYNILTDIEDAFDNQAMTEKAYDIYMKLMPLIQKTYEKKDVISSDELITLYFQIKKELSSTSSS